MLLPCSTNKLLSHWQGPNRIIKKVSENSCCVELENGANRVLHGNKLRPFIRRVQSIGVIYEADSEMGELEYCPYDEGEKDRRTAIEDLNLSYLDEKRGKELRTLLMKYVNVFDDRPGECGLVEHEIKILENVVPRKQRPYRVPEKLKIELDKQIDYLLETGKIRPSKSPWSHPVVCVVKKDSSIRMCVDLRAINSYTIADAFPTSRIEDILMPVGDSKYMTALDCSSGYWQLKMNPLHSHRTAFITHRGLFEWVVMPFGAKTSSQSFIRCMEILLHPHSLYANAFIDDSIVFSKSWGQHLVHLDNVLKSFEEAGLTLKLSKCVFAKQKINFWDTKFRRVRDRLILTKF